MKMVLYGMPSSFLGIYFDIPTKLRNFARVMPFQLHIDIIDLILKGLLIGIIASAPMGPVGILCVHRTLNKGRWYGFATGIGATISDVFYALLAAFGMGFIMDFIEDPTYNFILQIVGSVVLLGFGIYCVI